MKNFIFFILVLCCFTSMAGNPSQTEINNRQGDFINKFFQSVVMTKNSNENFVFSPVSLNQSLGVLLNGANKKARAEIMQALNYNGLTLSDVNNYNHQILSSSDQSSYNKLLIANGLWISDTIKGKIKRDFLNTASRFYKADIHIADFKKQGVEDEIRKWRAYKWFPQWRTIREARRCYDRYKQHLFQWCLGHNPPNPNHRNAFQK